MSSVSTGYDLAVSTFSPDGRLFQIEYAQKAVDLSGTAIGLRAKDGIILAVEKLVKSKLYEAGDNRRIFTVDKHIGIAIAGLQADGRHLVEVAIQEASSYRNAHDKPIPLQYLKDRMAMYIQAFTLYSGLRPFGASLILAAKEHDGPQMYCISSSGLSHGYFGCSIGKAEQIVKTEMEKLKLNEMTCVELVKEAAKIIYAVHEVKDKDFCLELSWVGDVSNGKHKLVPDNVFQEAEKFAKDCLKEDEFEMEVDR